MARWRGSDGWLMMGGTFALIPGCG
jgi:hypothetical protein